jgi:hypothetical protein
MGLPVLALLLVALALPGAARASSTQFCLGNLAPIKATADRDTGVSYRFSCHDAITAFALVSSQEISSFDVSADVFDSGDSSAPIRGDDRLGDCEGEIPSFGFICGGTYSAQGREVRSAFDTTAGPCARGADKQLRLVASIVVRSVDGKLNGPYRLGKHIKGCPRPAKHKKAAKHSRAAR